MYKYEELKLLQVQVKHSNCWGRRPRCVCAVAVRAGQDVFVIDGCNGMQYINFPLCNENSLKVIKETDRVYKVKFRCLIVLPRNCNKYMI